MVAPQMETQNTVKREVLTGKREQGPIFSGQANLILD